jgi:SsrA-binding protein
MVDQVEHHLRRTGHEGIAANLDQANLSIDRDGIAGCPMARPRRTQVNSIRADARGNIPTSMTKQKDKDKKSGGTIALNKRARHEYHIDERYEAGVALQGWEVKSLRAGRTNLTDAYAIVRNGEIYLFGASIVPLISASSHVVADDRRTRKLLLHRDEIDKLVGAVERKGYTMVPMAMYWKGNKVKIEIGLARGKQDHDKRNAIKEKDWQRDKQRAMRAHNKGA